MSIAVGTLVAVPVCTVVIVTTAVASAFCFRWWKNNKRSIDAGPVLFFAVALTLASVGTIIGLAWGMYPYSGQYHTWNTKQGEVTAVSSRFLGHGDDGTSQRFVVTLKNVGEFSCDDTRCALAKVGDTLSLTCKRAWQFSGTDGWDCNYESRSGAA